MDQNILEQDVISNKLEITHIKELFTQMVQTLDQKIDALKLSQDKGFTDINQKLDKFEISLDQKIDERIEISEAKKALSLRRWIIGTFCGSIAISIATNLLLRLF